MPDLPPSWTRARRRRGAPRLVVGPALAVVLAALAGCTGLDAEDEPAGPVVAFLGGADGDGRHYEPDAAGLRDALRADCEDCRYAAFDAEGDAETQAEQMTRVLEGGADVVLLEAVDAEASEQMVEQAGDVPVIAMDRFVPGADFHVGYDPRVAGRVLARQGLQQADEAPGVLLLGAGEGDLAGAATTDRARALLLDGGAEVLAEEEPRTATADDARRWTAEQIEQREPAAVDLVVAVEEGQAEGVVAAYDAAGVEADDRPAVVGTGAELASLRRLVLDQQAVAVREPREALISRTVTTAAEVLEGAPVSDAVDEQGVPSFLGEPVPVTLSTLTSVMVADGTVSIADLCEGDTSQACATNGIG